MAGKEGRRKKILVYIFLTEVIAIIILLLCCKYVEASYNNCSAEKNSLIEITETQLENEVWIEMEKNKRQLLFNEWLIPAQMIAYRVREKCKYICNAVEKLEKSYYLVAPDFSNSILKDLPLINISQTYPKNGIGILILTREDEIIATDLFGDGFFDDEMIIERIENPSIIIIHNNQPSKINKGLALIFFLISTFESKEK